MPLLQRMLLSGLCCLAVAGQAAPAAENGLDIHLSQSVDTQCDGLPDAASTVAPGECILYIIDIRNSGDTTIYDILVDANIPPHTQLERPLQLLAAETTGIQPSEGTKTVRITVRELQPGEQAGLRLGYSVRVL